MITTKIKVYGQGRDDAYFFSRQDLRLSKLLWHRTDGVRHEKILIKDKIQESWKKCVLCFKGRVMRKTYYQCLMCVVPLCISSFRNEDTRIQSWWDRFHTCNDVKRAADRRNEQLRACHKEFINTHGVRDRSPSPNKGKSKNKRICDEDAVQNMDETHNNSKIWNRREEDTHSYDSLESGSPNKKNNKISASVDDNTSKKSFESCF